jgi:hypothetical protein
LCFGEACNDASGVGENVTRRLSFGGRAVRAASNDDVDEEDDGSTKRGDGRRAPVSAPRPLVERARERGDEDAKGAVGVVAEKGGAEKCGAPLFVSRVDAAPACRTR